MGSCCVLSFCRSEMVCMRHEEIWLPPLISVDQSVNPKTFKMLYMWMICFFFLFKYIIDYCFYIPVCCLGKLTAFVQILFVTLVLKLYFFSSPRQQSILKYNFENIYYTQFSFTWHDQMLWLWQFCALLNKAAPFWDSITFDYIYINESDYLARIFFLS